MTTSSSNACLDQCIPELVRRWATHLVQTNRAPRQTPNAVVRFCQQHSIVLDLFEPRRTGQAILRVLALIDAAKQ